MSDALHTLSAVQAAGLIKAGRLSSVELVQACLDRISETDAGIEAWEVVDAERALERAAEMDLMRRAGRATGPLHGVPVGLKDIVDTREMPTERGSPICAGRRPDADAAVVERLLDAGAVIMGKTVTTEFAFVNAARTRNPLNPEFSPGGSSSGSAAAVAAGHVPLAIGSQTGGSVIRPASYCGIFGFKPTRGVVSRRGVLETSKSLDHLGAFARSLEDAALLIDVIGAYDPSDPASFPHPRPHMLDGARSDAPVDPALVWLEMPMNELLAEDAHAGLGEVLDVLGELVDRTGTKQSLPDLVDVHITIHEYEFCQHLEETISARFDDLSPALQEVVSRGRTIGLAQYDDAIAVKRSAEQFFAAFFKDYDAILTPSATGEAPPFGPGTGDPVFCRIWSLCGLPSVSLPVLVGDNGLPIGLQLVGAAEEDDRLLRTAANVLKRLQPDE